MFNLTPRAIVAASILALLGSASLPAEAQSPATAPKAVQSNPWDKYDTSDIKASAPKTVLPPSTGSNPWDKYATDKVPMVPFAPNTPETAPQEGTNPWDKYTPAAMPQLPVKAQKAQVKKEYTELAQPLPERKVSVGDNKVHNDLPVGGHYYYAIEYNGQLIGYSEFKVSNMITLGGRSSYLMNSSSRVKVGSDKISDLRYFSKLQVSKRDLTPSSLICSQKSALNDYRITCIYSPSVVAQNNILGEKSNSHVHQLSKENVNLIFNNLWGQLDTFAEHYWLLALSSIKGGSVEVYDPILRTDGKVTIYAPVAQKWTADNKQYNSLVYTISDMYGSPLAYVRLNAKTKELLEIKEIGSGLTFRHSNPGVIKQVDKAKGVNLWPAKVRLSNIYFSDPNKLTHLEADLDMKLRGGQLAQHSITGYEQKMYGTVKEGRIIGRVVVDVKPTKVKQNLAFPLVEDVPAELQPYLEFNANSEADDTLIYNKANELTWKADTAYQAARRLTGFIANNIENGISLPSALQTLEHGVGNPESKALLLVSMARSVGIPARCIGGLVYQRGEFAPHYWTELWMGSEAQWMAFDPSTNEAGSINASHIALWTSGDVQDLQIEVDKFSPHPPRQVNFFTDKLKWPVGEKRTYAIVSDGKRIGTETAHVQDLQLVDNRESYNFHAETAIFEKPQDMPSLKADAEEPSETAVNDTEAAEDSAEVGATDGANATVESTATGAANGVATANNVVAETTKVDNAAVATPAEAGAVGQNTATVAPEKVTATTAAEQAPAVDKAEKAPAETAPVDPPKVKAHSSCDNLYNSYGLPQRSTITVGSGEKAQITKLRFSNNRVYEELTVNGQTIEREVPVSNGLYLADQRFLAQWILALEQIPLDEEQADQEAGTYSINIFVPETLSSQELLLTEDEEQVEVKRPDGTTVLTTVLRAEKGMVFYVDANNHVIKLAVPNRNLELYLESQTFSLE